MSQDDLFKIIVSTISSLRVLSFAWSIYNYRQDKTGFLKLKLKCNSGSDGYEEYLICRTVLENTSRRPITIVHAFLLIVDQSISYRKGMVW
jgi:hypothetical protein